MKCLSSDELLIRDISVMKVTKNNCSMAFYSVFTRVLLCCQIDWMLRTFIIRLWLYFFFSSQCFGRHFFFFFPVYLLALFILNSLAANDARVFEI